MKVELIKFAGGLNVWYGRKRMQDDTRFLATGRMKKRDSNRKQQHVKKPGVK